MLKNKKIFNWDSSQKRTIIRGRDLTCCLKNLLMKKRISLLWTNNSFKRFMIESIKILNITRDWRISLNKSKLMSIQLKFFCQAFLSKFLRQWEKSLSIWEVKSSSVVLAELNTNLKKNLLLFKQLSFKVWTTFHSCSIKISVLKCLFIKSSLDYLF